MTITTKPKQKIRPNESEVQKLINKGGSVASTEQADNEPEYTSVLVRFPNDMLKQIDAAAKQRRPVKVSRNSWILESCYEQLQHYKEDIK